MKYSEYRFLVLSDLYRITGDVKTTTLIRYVLVGGLFKYNFWLRTCQYARSTPLLKYTVYPPARLMLNRLTYKFGISISPDMQIGSGFYIGHFGGIVVNDRSVIGNNCNISHGVTLAQANRGKRKGFPTLADNIYIGPGATIIGAVRIGNNVAIGAHCVVTKDVPPNTIVAGNPALIVRKISEADYENEWGYQVN